MTVSEPRDKLIDATRAALRDVGHRDAEIHTLHAPGRIEVFGKHTDYCGGRSLLVATEQGLSFSVAARDDARVSIRSIGKPLACEFELSPHLTPTIGDWSNYPMTVARRIARNFPAATTGCDIALASNLPPAAGMSSSSATIIGTFLCLDRVNHLRESEGFRSCIRSREEFSAYLGSIENGAGFRTLAGDCGVGTTGGSQDHTAILMCEADTLSQFAFCPVRHEQPIAIPANLRFVVGVSGVVAEKTGDALHRYNAVAERARAIVRLFNERAGEQAGCLADILRGSPHAADRVREMVRDAPELLARFD